ncbi:hypothetical protein AURDEDRAFT_131180 [Auricularia subglabra TFB-10046 SS5]|uniref:Uncharacterized protein n=1 Tax=Auricularia subglabra (strain TFB-10046 / SS5) TaxID=717982 RepID=J0WR64_AURST|nr:hypothetical protein AURDEDRAFT_131180 [Auricularia subglabra TFB-10046 SS5]
MPNSKLKSPHSTMQKWANTKKPVNNGNKYGSPEAINVLSLPSRETTLCFFTLYSTQEDCSRLSLSSTTQCRPAGVRPIQHESVFKDLRAITDIDSTALERVSATSSASEPKSGTASPKGVVQPAKRGRRVLGCPHRVRVHRVQREQAGEHEGVINRGGWHVRDGSRALRLVRVVQRVIQNACGLFEDAAVDTEFAASSASTSSSTSTSAKTMRDRTHRPGPILCRRTRVCGSATSRYSTGLSAMTADNEQWREDELLQAACTEAGVGTERRVQGDDVQVGAGATEVEQREAGAGRDRGARPLGAVHDVPIESAAVIGKITDGRLHRALGPQRVVQPIVQDPGGMLGDAAVECESAESSASGPHQALLADLAFYSAKKLEAVSALCAGHLHQFVNALLAARLHIAVVPRPAGAVEDIIAR